MGSRVRDFFDLEADEVSSFSSPASESSEDSEESSESCSGSPVDVRVSQGDVVAIASSQAGGGDDGDRRHVDAGGRASPAGGLDPLGRANVRSGRPRGASNRPVHERGQRVPRFRGTTFHLTLAQSGDVSVQRVMEHVSGFHDFEWACAVLEHHADGSLHIHCAVRYLETKDFTSPFYFDFDGVHFRIDVVKNRRIDVERLLKYLGKEEREGRPDANRPVVKHHSKVLSYDELYLMFTKAQGTAQVVAEMIRRGTTTDELLRNDTVSGWLLMNLPRVSTYRTAVVQAGQHTQLNPWDLSPMRAMQCRTPRAQHAWNVILSWLDGMINHPLPHRPRQLWIVGRGGVGKSLLIRHLAKMLRIYSFPKETRFHCLWEADTQLIVGDDVMIPIYDLLSWADGTTMTIEKKGGTTRKEGPYPFLMLSNNPPEVMYSKCSPATFDALAGQGGSRFFVLHWPDEEGLPIPDFTGVSRWEPPVDPNPPMMSAVDYSVRRFLQGQSSLDVPVAPQNSWGTRHFPGRN